MFICDLATRSNQSHGEVYSDACANTLRMHHTWISYLLEKINKWSRSSTT
ncbi:hypothetical protein LINGRAPRIM_LOCUS3398 [Linum grandiflorum]